jgi:hypothetical protein
MANDQQGRQMKQTGKVAWGVLIVVIGFGLAYAELKADAALNTELGVGAESNKLPTRAEPESGNESHTALPPFEYFPAQYRSSAESKSPEGHIQAF